jgi:dolichyl-phosphate-mannose--protein O-mannosyl transferase
VSPVDEDTPPVGEEIHLPGPTIIPFVSAAGITLMVIGTTINWFISIIGLIIFVVTTVMWIRDTRRDISELPEEHGH